MHVIMGLPRSGSTLLCNILAQNPHFMVEHTNMLPSLLQQFITMISQNPDIKGGLNDRPDETIARIDRCAKALCEAWHGETDRIIFNKSRGWAHNIMALQKIYPDAKIIVTIRDLREVFASFERQHQKYPLFDFGINAQRSMQFRVRQMFSAQGMIGACLLGIEDILHRKQDVFFVKYEDFVRHPDQMMERLYCFINEPSFEHDFDNVENTATDPDYLYLNKYPHDGSGKVEPRPVTWPNILSDYISRGIVNGFPWFFEEFKYIKPQKLKQEELREVPPLPKRLKNPK